MVTVYANMENVFAIMDSLGIAVMKLYLVPMIAITKEYARKESVYVSLVILD
jgi:hypothetical protein